MGLSNINWANTKMPIVSRVLLVLAGIILFGALLFPIWKMELSAPQYPEGLTLYLHANKLGGDVESINGLNHYIGMKTLHTEDFIEFTVLPYIITLFGLLTLASGLTGKKKWALTTLILFVLFAVIAFIDFYRWNYNYGHDLAPTAAIKVPGMAYQPPIIGYKQLLNFGVYSIPDVGGIIMLISGLIMAFVVIKDYKFYKIFSRKVNSVLLIIIGLSFTLSSCDNTNIAKPIKAYEDVCIQCKMTIVDQAFATELVTDKGKHYVFDDISCMKKFVNEETELNVSKMFVSNYLDKQELLDCETAFFTIGGDINSPMMGNVAAFKTLAEAKEYASKLNAEIVSWESLGL